MLVAETSRWRWAITGRDDRVTVLQSLTILPLTVIDAQGVPSIYMAPPGALLLRIRINGAPLTTMQSANGQGYAPFVQMGVPLETRILLSPEETCEVDAAWQGGIPAAAVVPDLTLRAQGHYLPRRGLPLGMEVGHTVPMVQPVMQGDMT